MRDAPYLHAKHLDEAVRQQVITSEQRYALDALARTMKPDGGRALPDLEWVRWMLAAATAAAVGLPGLIALDSLRSMRAVEGVEVGLVAVGVCAGVAAMLRDRRAHVMVKGVLAAGATAFAWLVGAGAGLSAFGLSPYVPDYNHEPAVDYYLPLWTIPGDLAVLLAALVLGRWLRAPMVLLPVSLAVAHAVVRVGTFLHVTRPHQHGAMVAWSHAAQLPWWIGASLVLVTAARLLDRRFPRGSDPAFWVHLAAPGAALVGVIGWAAKDPTPPMALVVLAVAAWCGLFGLAFVWRRVAWIAWGALGLAAIPIAHVMSRPFEHRPSWTGWILLSIGGFAIFATLWRRHMLATTPADGDERLPWG